VRRGRAYHQSGRQASQLGSGRTCPMLNQHRGYAEREVNLRFGAQPRSCYNRHPSCLRRFRRMNVEQARFNMVESDPHLGGAGSDDS
jgi:hypothetical protein